IRLLVQLDEQVSLVHAVIVVHQHPGHLAADAGGDEGHVTVHECIIRRCCVQSELDPGNTEPEGGCQGHETYPADQYLSGPRGVMNFRWGWPGNSGVASNRTGAFACRRRVGRSRRLQRDHLGDILSKLTESSLQSPTTISW